MTVSVVLPDFPPSVAVIVIDPAAIDVAKPLMPAALLTAATAVSDDCQVTDPVRSWFEPSEYIPVAVNCLEVPSAMPGSIGETWIEVSVAGVTASVVLPDFIPDVAVIVADPAVTDVARPFRLIVAKPESDEVQVTESVRSWLDPSE